ncbi:hypothetical protein [Nannocystis pusilla]|uniref:hypothetical protein n=1 Tax=Nannocystis pusilla TaxID=889268 RepID=UPI003DA34E73
MTTTIGRRQMLLAMAGAMGTTALGSALSRATEREGSTADKDRKLLFILCATGGASIVDSFLPVTRTEVDDDALADTLNVYDDAKIITPTGSNIRCPGYAEPVGLLGNLYELGYGLDPFLAKHHRWMTVLTQECTSVNHNVGQYRSVTGAGINRGRTIMEAMALRHGEDLIIPNCNMANDGYIQPGIDASLPAFAQAEIIASPLGFAAAMDGVKGVLGAPDRALVERARGVREELDDASMFGKTFADSPRRQRFLANRREVQPRLEAAKMMDRLTLLPPELLDPKYGVMSSPLLPTLASKFSNLLVDPWESQAALSVLLAYYGLSCVSTIGLRQEPTFGNEKLITTPIAFDFSHNDHRMAQYLMWGHVLKAVDALVDLLQQLDYLGDPALGKMWDRSLIYVATDFGRDKTRPAKAESWGTGHSLNNGTLIVSPLLKGNRVFGGIEPTTCETYGFDGSTGEATPGLNCSEGHIYSAIAQALDIEFPERIDMSALLA